MAQPVTLSFDGQVQKFSGTNAEYHPADFINRINSAATLCFGVQPEDIAANAEARQLWNTRYGSLFGSNLTGAAEKWYHTLAQAIVTDPCALRNQFQARYNTVHSQIENQVSLHKIQRQLNESIRDYDSRVERAVRLAFPNAVNDVIAHKRREVFLKGLAPQKIRKAGYEKNVERDHHGNEIAFNQLLDFVIRKDTALALCNLERGGNTAVEEKIDKLGENLERILNVNMAHENQVSSDRFQQNNFNSNRHAFEGGQYGNSNRGYNNYRGNNNFRGNNNYRGNTFRGNSNYRGNTRFNNNFGYRRDLSNDRLQNRNYDPNNPRYRQNGTRFCTNCQRNGHTKMYCRSMPQSSNRARSSYRPSFLSNPTQRENRENQFQNDSRFNRDDKDNHNQAENYSNINREQTFVRKGDRDQKKRYANVSHIESDSESQYSDVSDAEEPNLVQVVQAQSRHLN